MRACTLIAVDFDTRRVDRNGGAIWESELFAVNAEADARAFLAAKRRTVLAVISKRVVSEDGRWFRVEWVSDTGRVLCESEGYR